MMGDWACAIRRNHAVIHTRGGERNFTTQRVWMLQDALHVVSPLGPSLRDYHTFTHLSYYQKEKTPSIIMTFCLEKVIKWFSHILHKKGDKKVSDSSRWVLWPLDKPRLVYSNNLDHDGHSEKRCGTSRPGVNLLVVGIEYGNAGRRALMWCLTLAVIAVAGLDILMAANWLAAPENRHERQYRAL